MNLRKKLLTLAGITLFTVACSSDEAGQIINNDPTTFEIIANSDEHSTLEQVLIEANLVDLLNSGVYTIFAPTDEAFSTINLTEFSNEELNNLLLNHLITGNITSTDFANIYYKTNATETYSGDNNFIDVFVNVDGGLTINGNAQVTSEDFTASNGTVHFIDQVNNIPNIVDLASANPKLSSLVTALEQENLLDILRQNPDTSLSPFTVFAPDDDAFQSFLDENDEDEFETIDDILTFPFLEDVLTYHVLSGVVRENDIEDGTMPETLQGQTFKLNTIDTIKITDQNNRVIPIKSKDVTGSNGVIHTIENILLPDL